MPQKKLAVKPEIKNCLRPTFPKITLADECETDLLVPEAFEGLSRKNVCAIGQDHSWPISQQDRLQFQLLFLGEPNYDIHRSLPRYPTANNSVVPLLAVLLTPAWWLHAKFLADALGCRCLDFAMSGNL